MPNGYKAILISLIVLIPGLCVGISNFNVFPDTWLLVTLMLVTTVGVACTFTGLASKATKKVLRYCVIADIIIAGVLVANLASHLILGREISGAKQDVSERREEDALQDKRETERVQREIATSNARAKLAESEAKLQNAEAVRLGKLPRSLRRSAITAYQPEPLPSIDPIETKAGEVAEKVKAVIRTPSEIRAVWWNLLIALAIAECSTSVLAGAILIAVWEWDKNGNGIADHLEGKVNAAVDAAVNQAVAAIQQGAARQQVGPFSERTFRVLHDGRREVVASTNPEEIGVVWPAELPESTSGKRQPSR